MKAIIIAADSPHRGASAGHTRRRLLLDRSFVQHTVEYLLDEGIVEVDFVLGAGFDGVRELLGPAIRWGASFHFHSVPAGDCPADVIRQLGNKQSQASVLIAHADRLPVISIRKWMLEGSPALAYSRQDNGLVWTGWGVVPTAALAGIPQNAGEEDFANYLQARYSDMRVVEVTPPLAAHSYSGLLEANRRALAGEHPALVSRGREVEPGLWLGRNVSVHPTARILTPAFIGDNSRLGADVQVGPAVVIGSDCVVDQRTKIFDSVICEGSYVGEGLDLRNVFVDGSTLVNTRLDTKIEGMDKAILGSVRGTPLRSILRLAGESLLAALILLLTSPVFIMLMILSKLGVGPRLRNKAVLRTPAVADPARWSTFNLLYFDRGKAPSGFAHLVCAVLPALAQIPSGKLTLSGETPLTLQEIAELTPFDRQRHLGLRGGVFRN